MSNFTFLKTEWPEIHQSATMAESHGVTDPRTACFWARRTLEMAVHWLYQNDRNLDPAYDDALGARLHAPSFQASVGQDRFTKARIVKDLGNDAVHSNRGITVQESTQAVRELFHFLYWMARTYTRKGAASIPAVNFDASMLSAGAQRDQNLKMQTAMRLLAMEKELKERDQALKAKEQAEALASRTVAELDAEIARLRAEIAEAKKQNEAVPDNHDYSEAETRDFFIDLLLQEAGWKLDKKEDREYPVSGMPKGKGDGKVDYVLWGDDGLPLAVVEAKRTKKDAREGAKQAELYADCLETKFGRRPIIFYTNGYETWLWDDEHYGPRSVQGFYKKDELELLIQRRSSRKLLREAAISSQIVERPYQTLAIRAVCEHFENDDQRKSLVVMATGSGKTRTAIALVDILQRCNWAKRILFLADRRSLVKQAANAFKTFLQGCTPINLLDEKEDTDSRVLLSTYPTMMGMIDDSADTVRRFGPGHFDLIIIDEAHRSIYQKYGAIFSYFDSMLVGLTATPRSDIDRNTFRLFELEDGVPTFAYELDEAVRDEWLVPPEPLSVPVSIQRDGLQYDQLTDDEKEQWDNIDWGEDGTPDEVDSAAINKWLFNIDTADKILKHLMVHGLKVDGGDRLGKTIIFAKNHKHALFIQERFNVLFPKYKGKFARIIDNYDGYAETLLDDFSTPDKQPHVAISVDMLDTGIDIPEVVNLVFFKIVRSKTKFFQMIGRGTRLCPDLFGPGVDKSKFLIFDYCGNFEFFGEHPKGKEGSVAEPLSKKLFLRRLELLDSVRNATPAHKQDSGPTVVRETKGTYGALDGGLADHLHAEVSAMDIDDFRVRPERKYVETYSERAAWDALQPGEAGEIGEHLAGLPADVPYEDITARQFDLLMLNLQLAVLSDQMGAARYQQRVIEIAAILEEKSSIPAVNMMMELILEVQTAEFWQDVTVQQLERVRKGLCDLVQFIDRRQRKVVYSDFEDAIGDAVSVAMPGLTTIDVVQYKRKVTQYFADHMDHPVVRKLRLNLPLAGGDLAELDAILIDLGDVDGSLAEMAFGKQPSLGALVRSLVGLNRTAVRDAFANYLKEGTHTATQIRFVEQIIEMLTKKGIMQLNQLYEQPLTYVNQAGVSGLFSAAEVDDIISIIASINVNAGVSPGTRPWSV